MRSAKVSLCMIVKDEQDCLSQCLEAARPYVDEICLVDTGSVDQTCAIAESFGARIKKISWPNDFSAARNVSLEMARGDWILVLDADEVLRQDSLEEFNRLVDDATAIGAFQNVTNHGDEGKQVSCLILRLFRNMPEHRFQGAIHEQVITPILENGKKMGMVVADRVLDIDHYGYTEAARENKQKDERNRLHFEEALRQNPNDAYVWFKYGDFLRRFDDMEPVLQALQNSVRAIAGLSDEEVASLTYPAEPHAILALELIKLERIEEAHRTMIVARQRTRETPMLHWVWGHLNLKLGNWQESYDAFEACHALDKVSVHVPAQPGITAGRSVFGMARALLGLGERDQAIELFESGSNEWPHCGDLQKATARVRLALRDLKGAMELCTAYLSHDDSDGECWQIGAEIMLELGMWDKAQDWCERAQNNKTKDDEGLINGTTGECAFGQMQLERAADYWAMSQENAVCSVGLVLIRIMLGEIIPQSVDLEDATFEHALNSFLRRSAFAPRGEEVRDMISAGLALRPLASASAQKIVQNHLAQSALPAS